MQRSSAFLTITVIALTSLGGCRSAAYLKCDAQSIDDVYTSHGRGVTELKSVSEACGRNPIYAFAAFNVMALDGDYPDALGYFESKLYERARSFPEIYAEAGFVATLAGRKEDAVRYYSIAVDGTGDLLINAEAVGVFCEIDATRLCINQAKRFLDLVGDHDLTGNSILSEAAQKSGKLLGLESTSDTAHAN